MLLEWSNQGDEMGGAYSTHGRDEKYIQSFFPENLKVREQSEYPGVDGTIILEWILGK
jgi:hypothetical protein